MKNIYDLEEFIEELAEKIEPHLPIVSEFLYNLDSTDKPLSIFSVTSLFPKIESIRIGIYELAKIEEYYSLSILFRSLIEHFVKAQYLWLKTLSNENDEVGIDYWLFGQNQEHINYVKALKNSYTLIGIRSKPEPIEILKQLGIISNKKSSKQIKKKYGQFLYKNMISYISKKLKTHKTGAAPLLRTMLPRYSELSSWVHGGPESTYVHGNGTEKIQEIIEMSTFASLYTRWSSYMLFYQYNKNMKPLCQISQAYLYKFLEFNNASHETA